VVVLETILTFHREKLHHVLALKMVVTYSNIKNPPARIVFELLLKTCKENRSCLLICEHQLLLRSLFIRLVYVLSSGKNPLNERGLKLY
jgi:hypothetical protein